MSTCIEIDHPMYFHALVDCPGHCRYNTDNVDEIGDKKYVRPMEPSQKEYGKYNQCDINSKSDKVNVSQEAQDLQQ